MENLSNNLSLKYLRSLNSRNLARLRSASKKHRNIINQTENLRRKIELAHLIQRHNALVNFRHGLYRAYMRANNVNKPNLRNAMARANRNRTRVAANIFRAFGTVPNEHSGYITLNNGRQVLLGKPAKVRNWEYLSHIANTARRLGL